MRITSGFRAFVLVAAIASLAVFSADARADAPALNFYSTQPGSGNHVRWQLRLPSEPAGTDPSHTYSFELYQDFAFRMAVCDTQSAPDPTDNHTCTPDSDGNVTTDANLASHPGTAYLEVQFYPPGWVDLPGGTSCSGTQWCAAMVIESLSQDQVHGTTLNPTCAAQTGIETQNYAFITRSGVPHAPPDPINATIATFTPDPARDLRMNPGDNLVLTMQDSASGVRVDIQDMTSGSAGSMVASAANGFAQVAYAPAGTSCNGVPSDFHAMYATSSTATRVPWLPHSSNIAFVADIGHFDFCSSVTSNSCDSGATEGGGPTDGDDTICWPASASPLIPVSGCAGPNTGFDGTSYLPDWPDGTAPHPTSPAVASPLTGASFNQAYEQVGFETDLPRFESQCNRQTGAGCTLLPLTDQGAPAAFYPFFSMGASANSCAWRLGNFIPGVSTQDWGGVSQYGSLLAQTYLTFGGGGTTVQTINDFRQILSSVPCTPLAALSSPTNLNFGTQTTGRAGPVLWLAIQSTGAAPLTFTGPATIAPAGEFAIPAGDDMCSGQTVATGGACWIGVQLTAAQDGARSATLTLGQSNLPSVPATIALSGTGVPASAGPSPQPPGTPPSGGPTPGSQKQVELILCHAATTGRGAHKRTVQRCQGHLTSSPVIVTASGPVMSATLSKGHVVAATGIAASTAKGLELAITTTHKLKAGRYILTLRRHNHRPLRQTLTLS